MSIRKALLVALAVLGSQFVQAEDTWRFITLADWHSAEKYTQSEKNPAWFDEAVNQDIANVKMLKENYGGEFILLPGDSNGGHWDTKAFIKNNYPGSKPEEAILKAGHLCYSGMIDSFKKGGYSKLLMAVGDHEVGDNPWPAGSAVSRCQPQFRQAFAKEFNINPDGGSFLYEKPIGKAASRPLGTPFENTSYAYRHKNTLLITIDAFEQESPDKVIGDQGTVTGKVVGKHLEWLENVLSEARKDASIKHIFVQSHLPVIYPVRKVNSSGMLMDEGIESPFWKTMREYKVDIYFAGEVHANTVTKDSGSDLIQLVSRGNFFNNFLTLDISDDLIEVICHNQIGEKPSDGQYEVSGRLVIDKSGAASKIDGKGELALLDVNGRNFHFTFEEKDTLLNNPIMGLSGRENKEMEKVIRGERCKDIFPNHGTFGKHYSALTANVELVGGVRGKAGQFDATSRMGVFAMGPLHGNHAVSYSLWFKTTSTDNQLLINTGSIWNKTVKDFFNLHMDNGAPAVVVSKSQRLIADAKLNDGQWHHIVASMPHDGCRLSDVQIHVDGKRMDTRMEGSDLQLYFNQAVRLGFGGLNYSSKGFNALPGKPFVGALDEISIWMRPLSISEVASLFAEKDNKAK